MKTKWLLAALLVYVFVIGMETGHVILSPGTTNAQAVGYVASGQQAVTGTAAVVTGISYGTVCVKALAANSINVYLGGPGVTTSTGMEMAAGNAYCAPAVNALPFYVVASTTGASVSWVVSR